MVSSLLHCSSILHKYPLHEQGGDRLWRRTRPLGTTNKGEQGCAIEGCGVSFCETRKNKMYSKVNILNTLQNYQNFTTKCHSNSIAFDRHESPVTVGNNSQTKRQHQYPNGPGLDDDSYVITTMMQQPQNGTLVGQDISLISIWASFLKNVKTLYEFTRPYTIIGTVVGVTSNSLLAIEALSDLTPVFFLRLIMAWIPTILINTFSSGINQVYDVELDKVNKPFLPIASGEYSMKTGITVTIVSGLLAFGLAFMSKSPPILITVVSAFLLACGYSIDVPYLRGKRSSLFTALSIMYMRGIVVPFAFFAHTQKYILGRPLVYTRPVFFAASFVCTMAMTIALLKDLPDVEGDQVHGLNTLTVRIGRKKVFLFSNLAIMMAYGGAVIVGLTSPFMFSKIITVFGHCTMAAILMFKARTIDLSDNKSTLDFYLFIWKLLYAEYFLIPFVR